VGNRQFGSIRRLSSGRWQARYQTVDGRRITARETFPTKTDASLWLDRNRADRASGLRFDPRAGEIRLGDYSEEWLAQRVGIAKRTREIYASQLRLHILPMIDDGVPALGMVKLVDLTPALVRAWYRALQGQSSHSVAAKGYTRLRQILTQAVNEDRILKNPCRIEGGGVERHSEQRFASLEELYALAAEVPTRYRGLVLMAGLAGLRQGELFALRRGDVNLANQTVFVGRKRLRLESGLVIEDAPKTEKGRRTVSIPRPLVRELEAHFESFVAAHSDSYIFTSPDGRPIERSNFRYRVWVPATERTDLLGLRFHDLRHTAGTLAARTGATTKELMARLGHASHQAAMVYQHAAADRDRQIADGLERMVTDAGLDQT
jgi:integrase